MTRINFAAAAALAAFAGGCAVVRPQASFPAVEKDVATRTGDSIDWHDGSAADKAVDDHIAALLAKPLDANAAVQIALLNNRRLQATYENIGVAQADLAAAGLLKNPAFSAAYEFGEHGASPRIDLGLTFDFVDLLFVGVRKHLAAAELETVKATTTAAVLDLAGQTREAFYACQAAQQDVELRKQIVDATAAAAALAGKLREAGNTTALALVREQALAAEAGLAMQSAEADAMAARERLTSLLGVWGGQTRWTIAGRLADPTGDEVPSDGLEKQAVASSLNIKIASSRMTTALQQLGVAQPLGALSELETGVSAEREGGLWYTGPSVTLPMPIFSQGQPAAARAAALARQADANVYATAVEVRSAARAARARVVALRQQVDSARTSLLPLREQVVHESQLQYNAMQIGAFELLSAKRDQIESATTYLHLRRDYWTAKSRLDLILAGRLPLTSDLPPTSVQP